jgi:hypothetical protein
MRTNAATIASAPSSTPAVDGAGCSLLALSSRGPAAAIAAAPSGNGSALQKNRQVTTAPMPKPSTAILRLSSDSWGTTTRSAPGKLLRPADLRPGAWNRPD